MALNRRSTIILNEDGSKTQHTRLSMLLEETAAHNIYTLEADSEHLKSSGLHSPTLHSKMEILAWTIRAIPYLADRTVWLTLNAFRRKELPLVATFLEQYY